MWAEIAGALAFSVVGAASAWAFRRSTAADPVLEGDALILRPPALAAWTGWTVAVLAVGLAWFALEAAPSELARVVLLIQALTFAVAAVWVLLGHYRLRVWVRQDGLEAQPRLGFAPVFLAWRDIEGVSFKSGGLHFRSERRRIRVRSNMVGILALAYIVERHLADRGGLEAVERLRRARNTSGF